MPKVIVHCDTCDAPIEKWPSLVKPHNFCNDACYRSYRKTLTGHRSPSWKGGPVTMQCEQCGKPFDVVQAAAKERRFCSVECKVASQRKPGQCLACGKPFRPTRPGRKFCSYACYQAFRLQHPKPCSPETRAKIAATKRGKPGMAGPSNPMFKNGWSAIETKRCPECGKSFRAPAHQRCCSRQCAYAKQGERLRRFYHETPDGQALIARYRKEMRLLGNPAWKHEEYAPGFTKSLKRRVLHRDGHKCRLCGTERITKGWLVIHHIDGSKNNHDLDNLITLCKSCHMRVHRNGLEVSIPPHTQD